MKNRSFTALVTVGFVLAIAVCDQAAALSVGTACVEANFTNPPTNPLTTGSPTTFAFLANTGAAARSIVSVDLFIGAQGIPHNAAISIWSRSGSGEPATQLGGGTVDVGLTIEIHRVDISPTITLPAGTDFFIAVDNGGRLYLPFARRGTTRTRFYHSPPTWIGPFGPSPWAYRVNCQPEVPEELQDLVDNNPGTPLADKLEDVIEYLNGAFQEFNKLPPDYQAALGQLEGAVGVLEAAIDDVLLDPDLGALLMDDVAGVAREWAVRALGDARSRRADPFVIAEAEEYLEEGDLLRDSDFFKDAINEYKDALAKAESAVTPPPPPSPDF